MKIFWAWQSDTPGHIGRFFVRDTLNAAIAQLKSDAEIIEPTERETRDAMELDHDRKGVPGSPDLARTIMEKIEAAAVFVADMTPVGVVTVNDQKPPKRLINHNVAIELGYSLRTRTDRSLLMVMNIHYGNRADLPFDVAHKGGPFMFDLAPDADKKTIKAAAAKLKPQLVDAIKLCIADEANRKPPRPEPAPFRSRSSEGTPGRFKSIGVPIGVSVEHFARRPPKDITLSGDPVMWFRAMPTIDPARTWRVTELQELATRPNLSLSPISRGWRAYDYVRGPDGFGIYPPIEKDPATTLAVVFAFTNAEIWSCDTYSLKAMSEDGRNSIPLNEGQYEKCLVEYAAFLEKLGVKPPYRWIAGMENLLGRGIISPQRPGHLQAFPGPRGTCLRDTIVREGIFSPNESPSQALKPFFTDLYDACGETRPDWLDENTSNVGTR